MSPAEFLNSKGMYGATIELLLQEYHEQFCRMPTDNDIREKARRIYYESQDEKEEISFMDGAKWARNFTGDAVEFAEWIMKNTDQGSFWCKTIKDKSSFYNSEQLYQLFLNQKNKGG